MSAGKILILSASIGHGHLRAAEALEQGLRLWFPGYESRHVDIMETVPALMRVAYKDMYLKMVQSFPELWGYLYARSDSGSPGRGKLDSLRKKLESASSGELRDIIEDYRPDQIICTHFTPQQVLGRWKAKGRLNTPLWVCVTDFVAHRYWLEKGMDGYFTATEENVFRMRRRGLENENIYPYGIPVVPSFIPPSDPQAARVEAAQQFGLDPAKKCFLLMGGGAGIGDMLGFARDLVNMDASFQLVVLTGNNQELLRDLQELAGQYPGQLFPLGFTLEVHKLLAASDLVLSKPGGLTTSECLAMGKPMLIYSSIPGQEDFNADYLLENGAAMKAPDSSGLVWRIRKALENPALLKNMSENALKLSKPHSARDILAEILKVKVAS